MNDKGQVGRASKRRWPWVLIPITVVALALGSAGYVSTAEERDVFCASCHLKPEQTYVDRARVNVRQDAADLASAHALAGLNCVGCHRGDQEAGDRIIAFALGARNTAKFVVGRYDPDHSQVAVPSLLDDGCRHCHVSRPELGGVKSGEANLVTAGGFDNHFHTLLFDAKIKTSVTCISCHPAHRESFPELQFMDRNRMVFPSCEQCHREADAARPAD